MDNNINNNTTINNTNPNVPAENSPDASVSNPVSSPTPAVVPSSIPDSSSTPQANTQIDILAQFAERIIREQEGIIGPIAFEQASKVPGIKIDSVSHTVTLEGDKKNILESLVKQYELLFGRVSIEICKEAIRSVVSSAPADQIPQILL